MSRTAPIRRLLLEANIGRPDIARTVEQVVEACTAESIAVRMLAGTVDHVRVGTAVEVVPDTEDAAQGCELVLVLGGDGGLDRDRGHPVALHDQRLLGRIAQPRQRGERDRRPGRGRQFQVLDRFQRVPVLVIAARHHVDQEDAVAQLGHHLARIQRRQRPRDLGRGQAQLAGAVLIDLDPDHPRGLVPV